MNKEIYFDNSSTTRILDVVFEETNRLGKFLYGNPSSLHRKGIEAEEYVVNARKCIASYLKCDHKELIFTSGATESNNLAIIGYLRRNKRKGNRILTTKLEHPSILKVFDYMKDCGYEVEYVNVDEAGQISIEDLKAKLTKDTALVSFTYVNSEIGTIANILDIKSVMNTSESKAVLHIDAVQGFGKMVIHPKKLGIDLMSISSHKVCGPKGVGALFVDKAIKIEPIILGGGQENGFRAGTENVIGIHGFCVAVKYMYEHLEENSQNIIAINDYLRQNLYREFKNVSINSPDDGLPNILNVSFEGVPSEILLHSLEDRGIYVSTGSACSTKKKLRSNVLMGINIKPSLIDSAIRLSFSNENTLDEAKVLMEVLNSLVPKLSHLKK